MIIKQSDEENCIDMIQYFNAINNEFLTEPEVKKTKLSNDGSFYTIHSPEKIKLRPRDSAMLNLTLKVNFQKTFNRKLKLDLKQKKRRDNSTRYLKHTLL